MTLFASADVWRRHGLQHPNGPACRGYPDTMPHAVSAALLRDVADRIPFELVEDFLICGNAAEVHERLEPFIAAGTSYIVLADMTGFVQPPTEIPRCMQEVGKLVAALKRAVRSIA